MDLGAIETSAAGMRAQRLRMETAALNLANAETTSFSTEERRGPDGASWTLHVPYRRRVAIFYPGADGRPLARVVEDASPFRVEHEAGHPHAVPAGQPEAGTLRRPNVHPLAEMTELMAATRAYEANVAALDTAKAMHAAALRILA
jgi:flagellar basal-body rod protein FlgC